MRETLPDWNDLPDDLRCDLVRIAEEQCCGCCALAFGGDLAVQFYAKLRGRLPAVTFPLFERRPATGRSIEERRT